MVRGAELTQRRIRWPQAFRIIASRFPIIDLFERVAPNDSKVQHALILAEMLVNPRLRQEAGEIHLVSPEDCIFGSGSTMVMAPFTHCNPKGSRFSDGRYGVYYAARTLDTAIQETVYHFGRFARDSGDGQRYEDMRVLIGTIDHMFHDIRILRIPEQRQVLDPNTYRHSQAFAAALRDKGSNGIFYPSVRHESGYCVAAFKPRAVKIPVQGKHLKYHWDGTRVARYFDYETEQWHVL